MLSLTSLPAPGGSAIFDRAQLIFRCEDSYAGYGHTPRHLGMVDPVRLPTRQMPTGQRALAMNSAEVDVDHFRLRFCARALVSGAAASGRRERRSEIVKSLNRLSHFRWRSAISGSTISSLNRDAGEYSAMPFGTSICATRRSISPSVISSAGLPSLYPPCGPRTDVNIPARTNRCRTGSRYRRGKPCRRLTSISQMNPSRELVAKSNIAIIARTDFFENRAIVSHRVVLSGNRNLSDVVPIAKGG
jgi:hypothetical protein